MTIPNRKPRPHVPITVRRAVLEAFERDGRICATCGERVPPGGALQLDHIIPVSRGGSNAADNLRMVHAFCNRSRNNRSDEDYDEVRLVREAAAAAADACEPWFDDGRDLAAPRTWRVHPQSTHAFTRRRYRSPRGGLCWETVCSCGWRDVTEPELEVDAVAAAVADARDLIEAALAESRRFSRPLPREYRLAPGVVERRVLRVEHRTPVGRHLIERRPCPAA